MRSLAVIEVHNTWLSSDTFVRRDRERTPVSHHRGQSSREKREERREEKARDERSVPHHVAPTKNPSQTITEGIHIPQAAEPETEGGKLPGRETP